jgi:hypothetical protein
MVKGVLKFSSLCRLVTIVGVFVSANKSHAEPVDCGAVKKTQVPFEITLKKETPSDVTLVIVQVARESSGVDEVRLRSKSPSLFFVQKATAINGWNIEFDRQFYKEASVYPPRHHALRWVGPKAC